MGRKKRVKSKRSRSRRTTAAPAKKNRRRRGSGKIGFTVAGIKRGFDLKSVLLGLGGALGARALYGLLVEKFPDLDDKARAVIAAMGPGLAGIAASGSAGVVVPLAIGGAGMALADTFADDIADAAGDSVPEGVKDGLTLGVGYAGKAAALPSPDPLMLGADAAALQVSPPPLSLGTGVEDTGIGEVRVLKLV
jgi:hypothetical protein